VKSRGPVFFGGGFAEILERRLDILESPALVSLL